MELLLICAAIAYTLTGKFSKDTNQAAYKAGKEPPGLARARMRHESGGGARKPSGKPAGKGATRLLLSQRWSHACEKAKDRADDKHRRWQAWYAEQAPHRDEQWRGKQEKRLANSKRRADKFAQARGMASPTAWREDRAEKHAWDENTRHDTSGNDTVSAGAAGETDLTTHQRKGNRSGAALSTDSVTPNQHGKSYDARGFDITDPAPNAAGRTGVIEPESMRYQNPPSPGTPAEEAVHDSSVSGIPPGAIEAMQAKRRQEVKDEMGYIPSAGTFNRVSRDIDARKMAEHLKASDAQSGRAPSETTSSGGNLYQQQSGELTNHAEEVDGYRQAISQLADELESRGWGSEVHGALSDMQTSLSTVASRYRDTAEDIHQQGDAASDAYDDAPWAPDRDALV